MNGRVGRAGQKPGQGTPRWGLKEGVGQRTCRCTPREAGGTNAEPGFPHHHHLRPAGGMFLYGAQITPTHSFGGGPAVAAANARARARAIKKRHRQAACTRGGTVYQAGAVIYSIYTYLHVIYTACRWAGTRGFVYTANAGRPGKTRSATPITINTTSSCLRQPPHPTPRHPGALALAGVKAPPPTPRNAALEARNLIGPSCCCCDDPVGRWAQERPPPPARVTARQRASRLGRARPQAALPGPSRGAYFLPPPHATSRRGSGYLGQ